MATTTPDSIYYPVSTDQIAPLETVFTSLATSVQTAFNAHKQITVATAAALNALPLATYPNYLAYVSGNGSLWYNTGTKWQLANEPVVASSAARDALYTVSGIATVTQGDQVFRNDLGYTETYYGLYNVSTNPGGRTPAGWYGAQRNMGLVPMIPTVTAPTAGTVTVTANGIVTATAASNVSINSCFTADFDNYLIVWDLPTISSADYLASRLRNGTDDALLNYSYQTLNVNGTSVAALSAASVGLFGLGSSQATGLSASGELKVFQPFKALNTRLTSTVNMAASATSLFVASSNGIKATTTSYDGITIYPINSATRLTGTFRIYGYN